MATGESQSLLSESSVSRRNVGVDVARILAILLVVFQHILFLGGLENDGGALRRLSARFLEAMSQCCVDLFGLISGYMGYRTATWHLRRFAGLWFQVWTTGLLVLGVMALAGASLVPKDWLQACFPLVKDEYWYFTGYAVVFALAPLVNRLPCRNALALILFLIVSVLTCWPGGLAWLPLNKGYSAAWLLLLFLFGAVLRTVEERLPKKSLFYFLVALGLITMTVGQRLVLSAVPALRRVFGDEWTLLPYTSPTTVLTAAALLLGLAKLELRSDRVCRMVGLMAPCAFGIYLIHVQPVFFEQVWKGHFTFLNHVPDALWGAGVVMVAVVVFLFLCGIEWGRLNLMAAFKRLIRLKGNKEHAT